MRHRTRTHRFDRTTAHRRWMFANLVTSLIQEERVTTTVPKAKEARRFADRLITLGKRGTLHARRLAQRTVRDAEALDKLFRELGPRYASRPGGYSRVVRVGLRRGDAAPMAVLELVDRVPKPAPGDKGKKVEGEKGASAG